MEHCVPTDPRLMSEFMKTQFFSMHGVPAGAEIAKYVEHEAKCRGDNVNGTALRELEKKTGGSVASKYKPDLPLHIRYCESLVNSLESTLGEDGSKSRHVKLIKERDKFVSRFMSTDDERCIDKYLESLLKERQLGRKDPIDEIVALKIIHPTETSCNMYNMIKYRPYTYSEHTDTNIDDTDIEWSGFNSWYKTEKGKINFEKLLFIYIIIEFFDRTDSINVINCIEFVHDRLNKDEVPLIDQPDEIKEYAERLFQMYSSRLYEKFFKDVGAKFYEIAKQISMYVDYNFVFNQVPYVTNNMTASFAREGFERGVIHKFVSIFSKNPPNIIPDPNDILLVWSPVGDKRLMGFNFKTRQILETAEESYSPSRCELLLKQEIRFSNLMNDFVRSLDPVHYIITESRPPEKESAKDKKKEIDGELDKQTEKELKLLGKLENDQARRDEKSKLVMDKISMNETAAMYKQEVAEMRKNTMLASIEAKKKTHEWTTNQKERDTEIRTANRLALQIGKKEVLEQRMISQTRQSILRLIDNEDKMDQQSAAFKTKMLDQTLRGTNKTQTYLVNLMKKIERKLDAANNEPVTNKQPGLLSADSLFAISKQVEDMKNLYKNLDTLMNSFGISASSDPDDEVNAARKTDEATSIANKMDDRIEHIILTNLSEWDKDVVSAQERLEDVYKKIENVLMDVRKATPIGESIVNYEKENDFVYDDKRERDEEDMLTDDLTGFGVEDRAAMVAQVKDVFKTKPKLYTIEDSYKKTVRGIKESFKKTSDLNVVLNKQNAKLQSLYNEAIKTRAKIQIHYDSLKAKYRDVSRINSLVSRAINNDMKKSSKELEQVYTKLKILEKKTEENEKKYEEKNQRRVSKLNELILTVQTAIVDMSQNMVTDMEIKQLWDVHQQANGSSVSYRAKKIFLEDMMSQQTQALDGLRSHQRELENLLVNKANDQKSKAESHTSSVTNDDGPVGVRDVRQQTDKQPEKKPQEKKQIDETTKRLHGEIERREIMRQTATQIAYGNRMYDKMNKLKKSGKNAHDILRKRCETYVEPQIINVPNIFRKAEVRGDIDREDVNFIKMNLQERWKDVINEDFPTKITVNINGVQQEHKDEYFFLSTYVIPCIRILYDDPAMSTVVSHDPTFFNFDDNINEMFNEVLKNRRVHDQILNLLLRHINGTDKRKREGDEVTIEFKRIRRDSI